VTASMDGLAAGTNKLTPHEVVRQQSYDKLMAAAKQRELSVK
jgi:hypothetical protein